MICMIPWGVTKENSRINDELLNKLSMLLRIAAVSVAFCEMVAALAAILMFRESKDFVKLSVTLPISAGKKVSGSLDFLQVQNASAIKDNNRIFLAFMLFEF